VLSAKISMNIDDMTVEVREGLSHGLRAPTVEGSAEYKEQLQDMLILCRGGTADAGYTSEVMSILHKYAPGRQLDVDALRTVGFPSWLSVINFVKDDKCVHMGLIVHELVTKKFQAPAKKSADFIDGEGGVGFYTRLMERMKRALEKAFDEKYFHKSRRPLQYLRDHLGMQSAMANVHYAHPGHWRYPAGHGVKFATVYDYVTDSYELTDEQENAVFSICYIAAMARSGAGVHLPEDNVASWSLIRNCDIDEKYKES